MGGTNLFLLFTITKLSFYWRLFVTAPSLPTPLPHSLPPPPTRL